MPEDPEPIEPFPGLDVDTIRKRVKLSYDGRQLMIRIPREVAEFYALEKGDVVELCIQIAAEDPRPNREIPMELRVVEKGSV